MSTAYLIGIDIGTGSTKAVAVDAAGTVVHTAQQYYEARTEDEKTEQDVAVVFQAFQVCIRQVAEALGQPPLAVCLSSAMHSLLAVNKQGKPLTPAMLWSDTRSSRIAEQLRSSELGKAIYLATGTPLHSMSPLCKIKWMKECQPAIFAQAYRFLSIKEHIWNQLFGEYVIDHSLASATGLFNSEQQQWENAALQFAGISAGQLSRPVPVSYKKTGLEPSVAKSMAIPASVPFFVGASDGALANLGSFCLSPSEAAITIGTSAAVRITSPRPVRNAEQMIFNYLLEGQTFVCGGAINNGGNVFQWLLENVLARHKEVTDYEQLFQQIAQVAPGSEGLLFLPYLYGERAPLWDEKASGAFLGIRAAHQVLHFARATAEGICFALHHILSLLEEICGEIKTIHVSGGLVHTPVMMQMLADVSGKNLVVQQSGDASAMGAVYLAQKALGLIAGYEALPSKPGIRYQPQDSATVVYQRMFPVYKSLYPLLKEQMHRLEMVAG